MRRIKRYVKRYLVYIIIGVIISNIAKMNPSNLSLFANIKNYIAHYIENNVNEWTQVVE